MANGLSQMGGSFLWLINMLIWVMFNGLKVIPKLLYYKRFIYKAQKVVINFFTIMFQHALKSYSVLTVFIHFFFVFLIQVFRHLVEKVNCRLLFATHYHPLTKEFASHPHVTLQHMACTFKPIFNNAQSTNQQLIFLYRLTNGACPESYGMQVALMAGIPKKVVEAAAKAGEAMKTKIGVSFRSSERRSEFSTLHEEWLKQLLTLSKVDEDKLEDGEEDDVFDQLFCLWHELKCSKEKLK